MAFSQAYVLTRAIAEHQKKKEFIPTIVKPSDIITIPPQRPKSSDRITAAIDRRYGEEFWNIYYFRVNAPEGEMADTTQLELLGKTTITPNEVKEFTGMKLTLEQILRKPGKLRKIFSENSLRNYFSQRIAVYDITLQASQQLNE